MRVESARSGVGVGSWKVQRLLGEAAKKGTEGTKALLDERRFVKDVLRTEQEVQEVRASSRARTRPGPLPPLSTDDVLVGCKEADVPLFFRLAKLSFVVCVVFIVI